MILIIGGKYENKEAFARNLCPDAAVCIDGKDCELKLKKADLILHFETFMHRLMECGQDVSGIVQKFFEENPKLVLVSDETGCGIVPCDAAERRYREILGRELCKAAELSTAVYRVFAGIGEQIK